MDAAVIPLRENAAVQELMNILRGNGLDSQLREVNQLIGYVDTMEKKIGAVLDELSGVRQQLNELKDKQHPLRAACVKMLNALQENVNEAKQELNSLKNAIIEGAKNAVAAFKENGIAALNSVMKFFKVKDGLNALRDSADKSIKSVENSVAKIETMSNEIHAAGSHMRNIGRAARGKETLSDVKENGKLAKAVQSPFKAVKTIMSGIKKAAGVLVSRLDQLDAAAKHNREKSAAKTKKPSILKNVAEFRPPPKEPPAPGADKAKKLVESL